jgi:hypothetical protein
MNFFFGSVSYLTLLDRFLNDAAEPGSIWGMSVWLLALVRSSPANGDRRCHDRRLCEVAHLPRHSTRHDSGRLCDQVLDVLSRIGLSGWLRDVRDSDGSNVIDREESK